MDKLIDQLKESRSSLSDGSLRTYKSIITNLFKKMNEETECKDYQDYFSNNVKDVLEFLKDVDSSKRKTTLSALVILCHNNKKAFDKYRGLMMEDSDKARQLINDEEKTDKQRENWLDWEYIVKTHLQLQKEVAPLMQKDNIDQKEFLKIQDYILLSLYVLQDPRRSEDYALMKIKGDKKDTSYNYIDGKNFIFNVYKTAGLYDTQKIPISTKLKTLLNKWMKINNSEWLLYNPRTQKALTVSQITHALNRIFGKKISSSMLRHIFLSHVYDRDQMETLARNMGHSVDQAVNVYAKK